MEVKSGTTSESPTKVPPSTTDKQEAFAHLAQGKRHLLVRDYHEAVTSLGQACQLLAEQYGETANECGDAYFCYGKALLELSRTEDDVLGDAIEGDNEGSDGDEDEDEDDDDDKDKIEEGIKDENGEVENGKDEGSGKEDDTKSDKPDENEEQEGESGEGGNEDDVSNLKLAWEVLEMAKNIFEKQSKDNKQLCIKLAEVHLKLGEVGLESENYIQAIEDMTNCLRIQIDNLKEDDRCIAETHYQLGIAYSMNNDFDDSIKQFTNAVNLIEKRIKNLEERKASGDTCVEETNVDPFYKIDEEIAELKNLLPEVKEKVSDTKDFKMETLKVLLGGVGERLGGEGSSEGASSSGVANSSSSAPVSTTEAKPVSNISHLVRKKRKLPEEDSSKDNKD